MSTYTYSGERVGDKAGMTEHKHIYDRTLVNLGILWTAYFCHVPRHVKLFRRLLFEGKNVNLKYLRFKTPK